MVESGSKRKERSWPARRAFRAKAGLLRAASCGDGVRRAMGAVVEWAEGGVRRGWRRFGGIGPAAQQPLARNRPSPAAEPSPQGRAPSGAAMRAAQEHRHQHQLYSELLAVCMGEHAGDSTAAATPWPDSLVDLPTAYCLTAWLPGCLAAAGTC